MNRNRLFAVVLLLALFLSGCRSSAKPTKTLVVLPETTAATVPETTAEPTTEPTETTAPTEETEEAYVLNRNTKKFHYPSCSSANEIKEKNRKDLTASREEILNMGYSPCKRCNP